MSTEEAIFTVVFALVCGVVMGYLAGYGFGWNAGHAAAEPKVRTPPLFPNGEVKLDKNFHTNWPGVGGRDG